MNAVGIDVSKGKSMVAIMRPFGEIVSAPFEIKHTASDINSLVELINSVEGEARIVMEHLRPLLLGYCFKLHNNLLFLLDFSFVRRYHIMYSNCTVKGGYGSKKIFIFIWGVCKIYRCQ